MRGLTEEEAWILAGQVTAATPAQWKSAEGLASRGLMVPCVWQGADGMYITDRGRLALRLHAIVKSGVAA